MPKSKKTKLNPQQRKFCKLYTSSREFFGNGLQSYAEAYDIDLSCKKGYSTARANASRLLTNADILAEINKLLDAQINEVFVDKQLAFLITQNAELNVKLGAIKEYNALKNRISQKMEFSGLGGKPIEIKIVDFAKLSNDTK